VLRQSFTVEHPRERVFAFLGQLDEVVACMPGAALTEAPQGGHVRGRLRIKLGPIVNELAGRLTADFARNLEARLDGGADSSEAPQRTELDAGSLLLAVVRARIKRLLARLLGR
jgi:carbon-monoxide dehydrogenase small subunit